jgi:hypothetical protein
LVRLGEEFSGLGGFDAGFDVKGEELEGVRAFLASWVWADSGRKVSLGGGCRSLFGHGENRGEVREVLGF